MRVSSDNSLEGIRYMDPISKVFYRNFTVTKCNPLYPNAVKLQNGSWITYGRQRELIDQPDEMPNHGVNVNWSSAAPMEELFIDDDLYLRNTAQGLRYSRKSITGRKVFPGQRGSYEHETVDVFNMNFRYGHQWHELLFFNYFVPFKCKKSGMWPRKST